MSGLNEVPPDGTKCVDCGCCQARIYAGKDAVCWECDDNVPCKGRQPTIPAERVEQVEKLAAAADNGNNRASLKVAKLLSPRRTYTRRKTHVALNADLPVAVEPKVNDMVFAQRQQASEESMRTFDHYDAVIQDLERMREQIGETMLDLEKRRGNITGTIAALRAFQQGPR